MEFNIRSRHAIVKLTLLFAWLLPGLVPAAESPQHYTATHAVAFMYHRFDEGKYPSTNVQMTQFLHQLDFLQREGFSVWALPRIVEHLRQRKPLPDKVVAITIDDAYSSVYENAFPVLKARNLPFTLFVSTDPLDQNFKSYMNWNQLREMVKAGVTIGNHSAGHEHLIRDADESFAQWQARVKTDITRAQQRLQEMLGVTPTLFAYPYGEYSEDLIKIVREMGFTAFGQQSGAIGFDSDSGFYARYPIAEAYADLEGFAAKALSYPLELESVTPFDPIVNSAAPPRMRAKLPSNIKRGKELACYASGQGRIDVKWLDTHAGMFEVVAPGRFSTRRFRYNCTLPTASGKRYYWFSHLWIRPELPEE